MDQQQPPQNRPPAARPPGNPGAPAPTGPPTAPPSKIQHSRPGIAPGGPGQASPPPVARPPARPPAEEIALPVAESRSPADGGAGAAAGAPAGAKIRAFEQRVRHEEQWSRTPNTTGTGAIHVKSFHCKLTEDALRFMDQAINEWLDAHPQYEVKFVNATIGTFTGKLKEPALICQVWV